MEKYRSAAKSIPWFSRGRETVLSRAGRCLVPVGVLPFDPVDVPQGQPRPAVRVGDPGWEGAVMRILGTAIQMKDKLLVTCAHVAEAVAKHPRRRVAILATIEAPRMVQYAPYPVTETIRYLDPRTGKWNTEVDLAVLIVPHISTPEMPYPVQAARWGDSARLGVGDPVVVGGYPHGHEMALLPRSNRGVLQPTFYRAIISGILPASNNAETRLLQLDAALAGGVSGGAVFDPVTGCVLGMITSGLNQNGVPLPHSWAIPSEVIAPYAESLSVGPRAQPDGGERERAHGEDRPGGGH